MACISVILVLCACSGPGQGIAPANFTDILIDRGQAGFSQADSPGVIEFPAAHGSHPDYRIEWWYFTGNLETEDGKQFGYQFTLFRYAIAGSGSPVSQAQSGWQSKQIYLAHAAISDIDNERMLFDEQFSRAALGMAGVRQTPFRAWLYDWKVIQEIQECGDCFAVSIDVQARDFSITLQLENSRAPVLHGDRGLSAKSSDGRNASYYYSYTRLRSTGELQLDSKIHTVTGYSWFDHEWSSSMLMAEQQGWDWFALQLSDQSEVMLFRLRHRDDASRDYYAGTRVGRDGAVTALESSDITVRPVSTWTSPATGVSYPASWEIAVGRDRYLVIPRFPAQVVDSDLRYWEGAVTVDRISEPGLSGYGYVELTGY